MRDFLSQYILTLSDNRRRKVYDVLTAAKVDKSDLDRITQRMQENKFTSPVVFNPETFGSRILSTRTRTIYDDTIAKLIELYNASNNVSLLLDTYTSVLSSEIKAIEDDIDAMTKAVENYAFTLADNGSYDFAYIETFNSDTIRLQDPAARYTDRNYVSFDSNERCFVDTASGTLTLTPAADVSHSMTGEIISSNCAAYITSDTGLSNALNNTVGDGWRVAVSAPRPISTTLIKNSITFDPGPTFDSPATPRQTAVEEFRQGAQFELEMVLTMPSPSDVIILTPFSDKSFEILLLEVYISKDNKEVDKITLVDGVQLIDRPKHFGFQLNTVSRVKMIINQPEYKRGQLTPIPSEQITRTLDAEVRSSIYDGPSGNTKQRVYRFNRKALTDAFLYSINKTTNKNETAIFRAKLPVIDFDPKRGPLNIVSLVKNERKTYGREDLWRVSSATNTIFRRMMHEAVLSSNSDLLFGLKPILIGQRFYNTADELNSMFRVGNEIPLPGTLGIDSNVDTTSMENFATSGNFLDYQYDLGFRNIEIGKGDRVFRGVFITKAFPADSDSGEVKVKVEDKNFAAINLSRDSDIITSIEYSITNKSSPQSESDWIPILPINYSPIVQAERLFFRNNGAAYLRFPAVKDAAFTIYRNGFNLLNEIDVATIEKIQSQDSQAIIGFKLPLQYIRAGDVYTVDYQIRGDQTIINFTDRGFGQTNVATAYDNSGAGETFPGTTTGRTIRLNYNPYIDYEVVKKTGSYITPADATAVGVLGFMGSYQPITIVMADGTVAFNQTNYLGRAQNNLTDFPETQTAYLQSGPNITFNRVITDQFVVYYQYLPSNLKARIILRVNDINYISPEVSTFEIKAKNRISDAARGI